MHESCKELFSYFRRPVHPQSIEARRRRNKNKRDKKENKREETTRRIE